jgi:hypothetical protein
MMLNRHENRKSPRHSGWRFLLSLRGPPESRDLNDLLDPGMRRDDRMWLTGQYWENMYL